VVTPQSEHADRTLISCTPVPLVWRMAQAFPRPETNMTTVAHAETHAQQFHMCSLGSYTSH
jgi:hypothetical protein